MKSYSQNPRIVLYSHDTMGLGHLRRNLLIGQALSKSSLEPDILLMTGIPEAAMFPKPTGVDCVVLPSLYKEQNGIYKSRRLRMSLSEIIDLRRQILCTSISTFNPDVMIVDGVPWGAVGELDLTLEHLRKKGNMVCVLGMRDIWDDPNTIQREWDQKNNEEAIRKYYNKIWIYGDPAVYDTVHEYSLSQDIVNKITYTGYLDQCARLEFELKHEPYSLSPDFTDKPFVLCVMGGGQDGTKLAEAFVNAKLPSGKNGIIVTGPDMDDDARQRLYKRTQGNKRITIINFLREPSLLMKYSDCVVSMGGYNTICEIISFRKRALVIPRVLPRKEQLIRALRFHELGPIDVLHPDDLEPAAITRWLQYNTEKKYPMRVKIDMNGLTGITKSIEALFAETKLTAANHVLQGDRLR